VSRLQPLGVLLAPGAGAGADQPGLLALDAELSRRGALVERVDFPYRRAGRRFPDRLPVLVDAVVAEAAGLRTRCQRLLLGGRSLGGRVCSVAVAEGFDAAGLILVSYPLHPPGRPERPRSDHLPGLGVPCLFVSGTADAFATVAELEEATALIPAPVTHRWIVGADHGLRGREREVAAAAAEWVEAAIGWD